MLVGFGDFGTAAPNGSGPVPPTPMLLTNNAIELLGQQMSGEQQCSDSYCLSSQSHLDAQKYMYLGIGAAAGAALGGLLAYVALGR